MMMADSNPITQLIPPFIVIETYAAWYCSTIGVADREEESSQQKDKKNDTNHDT